VEEQHWVMHLDGKKIKYFLRSLALPDVASEKDRRLTLWRTLISEDIDDIQPKRLRDLRIYGGAQGIWVDKTQTASNEVGLDGATVGVLHTGRHYADDLSDDGVIYHYPKTSRPPARDAAEVQATKNAMLHQLPIFIILPGASSRSLRSVKIGWVCDFDDNNRQFLILFGQETPPTYSKAEAEADPFILIEEPRKRAAIVLLRTGQQRFRFHVLSKYGSKCAVCDICHPLLVTAAHICGKSERGSDDWRNGIPLCSTHHHAFDNYLFGVTPTSHAILCKPGIAASDIGIRETNLKPLKSSPHHDALEWRWDVTQKEWSETTA
jgi:putative restriction endonuclease